MDGDKKLTARQIGGLALCLVSFLPCGLGETVYYSEGFEDSKSAITLDLGMTPDGLNPLASAYTKVLFNGRMEDPAGLGRNVYKFEALFMLDGYCNPTYYFKEPVPVKGPLYFSCKLRTEPPAAVDIQRIHPALFGEFPIDPRPVMGVLKTRPEWRGRDPAANDLPVWKGVEPAVWNKMPLQDGRYFFYSDDIQPFILKQASERKLEYEGAVIFGGFIAIWGCAPGTHTIVYIDDIRLTDSPPVPPANPEDFKAAKRQYQQFREERRLWRIVDAGSADSLGKREAELDALLQNSGDSRKQAAFIELMRDYAVVYWKTKWSDLLANTNKR